MRRKEKLTEEQEAYLEELKACEVAIADAYRLTEEFAEMVRGLEGEKLDGWLREAEASKAPVMKRFAEGLRKDLSAVQAGLTERWSNGPVEGFIHKLKLVKRQGHGRARLRSAPGAGTSSLIHAPEGAQPERNSFTKKPGDLGFYGGVCTRHSRTWLVPPTFAKKLREDARRDKPGQTS